MMGKESVVGREKGGMGDTMASRDCREWMEELEQGDG